MENSIIKGIVVLPCPHCATDIFIELQSTAPTIAGALTEEEINSAKDEVLKALEAKLDTAHFEEACNAIKDKTFLFGPSDVQNIIDQHVNTEIPKTE